MELIASSAAGTDRGLDCMTAFLSDYHQLSPSNLNGHLYRYADAGAIKHVFRVASSLDSLVVGESQILGQVKEAYRIATDAGTVGMHLSALMNRAFAVAKKVRTETGISQSAVSVSYAAVELARKIFGDLSGKTVMIIGASKMGELSAKHLRRAGNRHAFSSLSKEADLRLQTVEAGALPGRPRAAVPMWVVALLTADENIDFLADRSVRSTRL